MQLENVSTPHQVGQLLPPRLDFVTADSWLLGRRLLAGGPGGRSVGVQSRRRLVRWQSRLERLNPRNHIACAFGVRARQGGVGWAGLCLKAQSSAVHR